MEDFREASRLYQERNTLCPVADCHCGFVALDPADIDSWTQEPRRTPCQTCKGIGFVPRQLELLQ